MPHAMMADGMALSASSPKEGTGCPSRGRVPVAMDRKQRSEACSKRVLARIDQDHIRDFVLLCTGAALNFTDVGDAKLRTAVASARVWLTADRHQGITAKVFSFYSAARLGS